MKHYSVNNNNQERSDIANKEIKADQAYTKFLSEEHKFELELLEAVRMEMALMSFGQ